MKNINFKRNSAGMWVCVLTLLAVMFTSCKDPVDVYREFIVPNGSYYPPKAQNARANSGFNRIQIAWENPSSAVIVKASISWNNNTESVELDVDPEAETVIRIIEDLEEGIYSFFIRTYDADGNASIPVEVIGNVLGESYVGSLQNRAIQSTLLTPEGALVVTWQVPQKGEAGLVVTYTDNGGAEKTLDVTTTETTTTISDLKIGTRVLYTTAYKPITEVDDWYYASQGSVPYFMDITTQVLKNTHVPFAVEETPVSAWSGGDGFERGLWVAQDWITNEQGRVNGNVFSRTDGLYNYTLTFGAANDAVYPSRTITNGKIYQTVELEAGQYRLTFFIHLYAYGATSYMVANIRNDIPDTGNMMQALAYTPLPQVFDQNPSVSAEFSLARNSTVSLGVVATIASSGEIFFNKVELSKLVN